MTATPQPKIPIQAVANPIICSPYAEPLDHWMYDTKTGAASRAGFRRSAGYWYKTEKVGSAQQDLFAEQERDDLPLVNKLREEVKRWCNADSVGVFSEQAKLSAKQANLQPEFVKQDIRDFSSHATFDVALLL